MAGTTRGEMAKLEGEEIAVRRGNGGAGRRGNGKGIRERLK